MKLNEAETKFFDSKGADVAESLTAEVPAETPPEPTPEPEPVKAAPQEAPKEAPKESPKEESHQVPLAALHAERQKRQQAENERQQLAEQIRQIQAEIQRANAPQPPNPDEDPVGALMFQNNQMRQQLEDMSRWRAEQESARQQREAFSAFTQRVTASEQAYAQSHPDYTHAAEFAIKQYDKMLQASLPDPAQRAQQIQVIATNELARVVSQGQDPAEFIYNFARSLGYQTPAPQAAPQVAPQAVPDVVKTIQKGLQQQTSISGGSSPPSEMTPEMLAGIRDPQEFNKQWAKMFGRR